MVYFCDCNGLLKKLNLLLCLCDDEFLSCEYDPRLMQPTFGTQPTSEFLAHLKQGNVQDYLPLSDWNLVGVTLVGANLADLDFAGLDLRGADLSRASLQGVNLTGASLCRTNLEQTDLTGAILDGTELECARYDRHTQWPEGFAYKTSGAIGPGANLSGAYFNTSSLRGADLEGVSFLGAYVSGADFTGANLAQVRFSGSDMQRCFLTGAYLKGARLNSVNLKGADLRGADLTDVEMEHLESIAGADFGQVQGLSDELRSRLLSRPAAELDVWNSYTRRSTRDSLSDRQG